MSEHCQRTVTTFALHLSDCLSHSALIVSPLYFCCACHELWIPNAEVPQFNSSRLQRHTALGWIVPWSLDCGCTSTSHTVQEALHFRPRVLAFSGFFFFLNTNFRHVAAWKICTPESISFLAPNKTKFESLFFLNHHFDQHSGKWRLFERSAHCSTDLNKPFPHQRKIQAADCAGRETKSGRSSWEAQRR